MSVRTDNSLTRHGPEQGVERTWLRAKEIPSAIMCSGSLWHFSVLYRFNSMNQVREQDCILNEENRNVVSNNVKVTLISVKSRGKSMNVTRGISASSASSYGGESYKGWGLLAWGVQERGGSDIGPVAIRFENAMSTSTSSMYSSLWNTFMVKMSDLLSEDEILKQSWSMFAS
jgi:hypothetical protein